MLSRFLTLGTFGVFGSFGPLGALGALGIFGAQDIFGARGSLCSIGFVAQCLPTGARFEVITFGTSFYF